MKKRIMAAVLGFAIIFSTFSSDLVSQAEGVAEPQQVEEQTQLETPEAEIITEEQTTEEVPINKEEEKKAEEPVVTEEAQENQEMVSEEPVQKDEKEIVTEDVISDDTETENETVEENVSEEEEEAFSQTKEIDGVKISMKAAPGVLPNDSHFEAVAITGKSNISKIEDAVEKNLADTKSVVEVKAFDITIYDANGNEVQPDISRGNVQVTFNNIDTAEVKADANKDMEVFHIADSMQSAESVDTSVGDGQVSFEAEHFSTYAIVDITDETNPTTVRDFEISVEIQVDGKIISDNTSIEISKAKTFNATYSFSNLIINTDDSESLKKDHSYKLAEIDISEINLDAETADVKDLQSGEILGTISIVPNAVNTKAEVRFNLTTSYEGIVNGSFGLSFELDPQDENAKQEIVLPDGKTYTFEISEFKKEPPTISLTGSKKDDSTASWTATIKNSSRPESYTGGYKYVAELSKDETVNKSRVYVEGATPSDIKIEGTNLIVEFNTPNYTADGITTITYDSTVNFGLTNDIVNGNKTTIGSTINETPKLVDSNGDDIVTGNDASISFETKVKEWLKKESVGTIDSNGVIEWKITVSNNGYDIKNVCLYDLFGGDGANMTLAGDVKVNGSTVSVTNGTSSDNYSWKVDLENPNSDGQWIITYKSQIANYQTGYLKKNHTSNPKNDAWITYDYNFGDGEGRFTGPTVKAESSINLKAGIQITGKSYDPATHELTWEVAVNQEYQDITSVTVTDIIPANQEYVTGSIGDISIYTVGGNIESTLTSNDVNLNTSGNDVILDFADKLQYKKAVFQMKTKLVDGQRDVWTTNNNGTAFSNKVSLIAAENSEPQTDEAKITYTSEVLQVAISNYNYNNHTVDCEIIVDANKMDMKNVVLTNQLKYDNYELEVLEETGVTVNGTKVKTTNDSNGNIVVNLGDIAAGDDALKKVKFTAKVVSDKYQTVNNGSFTINDTATLVSEDILKTNDKKVEVTSNNIAINNSVLSKTGKGDKYTGNVTYTVYINKARNQLPEGFTVRDTIGSSLELDSLSVQLYECTISDADGQVTDENLVDASNYAKKVSSNGANTVLDVTLPQTDKVYKLTYNASVVDTKLTDCSNSIEIITIGYESASAKVDVKSQFNVGAEFTSALYLTVTANNKAGEPLSGVEYSVIDPDSNSEVLHLITKDNGVAKAVTVKLTAGKKYTIKEVVGPDGYESASDKETQEFVAGKSNEQIIPFEYEKLSTTIDIYSRENSEDGELLAGSKMKLIKDGTDTITWNSKDINPKNVKVYLDSEYVLSEEAPTGYNSGSNIRFTVVKDENDKLQVQVVSGDSGVPVDTINMVSISKNRTNIVFNKVSTGQDNELVGAQLKIIEVTSNDEMVSWVSDGIAEKISLPEGTYSLIENQAPLGYRKAESIKFRVTTDLKLEIFDEENSDYVTAENAKITMYDDYDADKTATVTISPDTLGMDPSMFSAMKFVLYRFNKDTNKLERVEPSEINPETNEYIYNMNYQDEYVLKPEGEIEGYNSVNPISMKVIGETILEDGTSESIIQTKNKDGIFNDSSLSTIGKIVTPQRKPVPAIASTQPSTGSTDVGFSAGATYTANNYYGSSKTTVDGVDGLTLKENDIVMGTDLSDDSQNTSAPRLAKTGGFVGTLFGYLTAVALILVGLYLTLGKKKEYDK